MDGSCRGRGLLIQQLLRLTCVRPAVLGRRACLCGRHPRHVRLHDGVLAGGRSSRRSGALWLHRGTRVELSISEHHHGWELNSCVPQCLHSIRQLPMAVGTKGGVLLTNPVYAYTHGLMGFPDAQTLAQVRPLE